MSDIVEILDPDETATCNDDEHLLLHLTGDCQYRDFFSKCLLRNEPCIIKNVTIQWPCLQQWVTSDTKPNMDYFSERYGTSLVTVAQCNKKVYNVHEKISRSVAEYVTYWKERKPGDTATLYLKDWHLPKEFNDDFIYRVPKYFASDWLNEYYDKHPELNDDYRFVYIGPKGTWTPLHADVFNSYSWSSNVVGEKRWVLLRPGLEDRYRDDLGNLLFDELLDFGPEGDGVYHINQGPGDAIFVPSGWHHQVWNSQDTISINHNWINGCNVNNMWSSMQRNLIAVEKEIADCRDMNDWNEHCQVMLKALYGFNYHQFYKFLVEIIQTRILTLTSEANLTVYGSWELGLNHQLFDIKQALKVLDDFKDEDHVKNLDASGETNNSEVNKFCNEVKDFIDKYSIR